MCTAHVKRILRIVLLLEKVKENFFFYFLMLILIAARSGASAASGGRVAALQLYSRECLQGCCHLPAQHRKQYSTTSGRFVQYDTAKYLLKLSLVFTCYISAASF